MVQALINSYERLVLIHHKTTLVIITALVIVMTPFALDFRLDASSDSLVLENDQALHYYREIIKRYGSDEFLIITYAPKGDLFSQPELENLQALRNQLLALQAVATVTSLLDVPLTQSPPVSLAQLQESIQTLLDIKTDRSLAKQEFLNSPLYQNLLISPDASTTALIVKLKPDEELNQLFNRRSELRELDNKNQLSDNQQDELDLITLSYKQRHAQVQLNQDETIHQVRQIMGAYRQNAQLFLGGVPMIVSDSIDFIRSDIVIFGTCVLVFVIIILTIAFARLRWVVLPLLTCFITGVIMVGLLGLLNWPVTVVSANFLSLLLIITLSLTIHLIVRYREYHYQNPQATQYTLVRDTVKFKFVPCFYTAITTIVAFASLLVSGIRPVIDFGWMMCMGISLAFVLTFSLFPALALLLKPSVVKDRHDFVLKVTSFFSHLVQQHSRLVFAIFSGLSLISVIGVSLLSVENRFIDYFKSTTEIHQGMKLIDNKLGGTTPLDVIIDAPFDFPRSQLPTANQDPSLLDEFDDEFSDEESTGAGITGTSYWFNELNLEKAASIHQALEDLPQTGKVLSIATSMNLFQNLKGQQEFDNFFLSVLYKNLPIEVKDSLISPYMSEDGNQLRFSIRVFESDPQLDRDLLLTKIEEILETEFDIDKTQINLTGMLVMYNNMLHSLFNSQILTLGVVFAAIFIMFGVLFVNLKLAIITLTPNVFAAVFVLGIMGWMSIPLDLMTITIAAISVGIAVDNAIHYVHRFSEEFQYDHDYQAALKRSHSSIGRALYYTTVTITLGFMILVFSNFVPTIYFGLLTGVAMVTALIANLTLLPILIARFHPLG